MLEALRIHSVLFDILSSMGISEIKSLELLLCAVLIVMGWSYLYVFYGYKICLVVVPAAILFFVNWMCKAAVRVELDATAMAELTKVNHFLIGCAESTATLSGTRLRGFCTQAPPQHDVALLFYHSHTVLCCVV